MSAKTTQPEKRASWATGRHTHTHSDNDKIYKQKFYFWQM